jgi:hypothetical protein
VISEDTKKICIILIRGLYFIAKELEKLTKEEKKATTKPA